MSQQDQLTAFGARIRERRDAILTDWRARVAADPALLTGNALPLAQLHDHLTAVLENFEHRLCATGDAACASSEEDQKGDAAAHGLHRWQQGFDLAELIRELGRLNESVVMEINRCATERGLATSGLAATVHSIWAALYSITTSSSADQFFRLQQIEAAGHVEDLEQALESVRIMESQRGRLWEQVAHDLRGNVSVVALAASGLAASNAAPASRERLFGSLGRNLRGLRDLLHDVTGLARLQGGQEVRLIAAMDVGELLRDIVAGAGELAIERRLSIEATGPDRFVIDGDAVKTRRIVQNLVHNALRYTETGGVVVSWGRDPQRETDRWFVQVEDTGPGIRPGPGSPLAAALTVASEQAEELQRADDDGEVAHVSVEATDRAIDAPDERVVQVHGEGIGLSIVKRLCTLLDATLQVDSRTGRGTRFTILLPVRYEA
jgi:signal transduction histidine kinase